QLRAGARLAPHPDVPHAARRPPRAAHARGPHHRARELDPGLRARRAGARARLPRRADRRPPPARGGPLPGARTGARMKVASWPSPPDPVDPFADQDEPADLGYDDFRQAGGKLAPEAYERHARALSTLLDDLL